MVRKTYPEEPVSLNWTEQFMMSVIFGVGIGFIVLLVLASYEAVFGAWSAPVESGAAPFIGKVES